MREASEGTSYKVVRLVTNLSPETCILRTICTSVSPRASTRVPLTLPFPSMVLHLSGCKTNALTQTSLSRSGMVGCAHTQSFSFMTLAGLTPKYLHRRLILLCQFSDGLREAMKSEKNDKNQATVTSSHVRASVQYKIRKRGAWSRVRPMNKSQHKDEQATARKCSYSLLSRNCTHDTVRRSLSLSLPKPSMLVRNRSGPHIHALPAFLFEHLFASQVSTHPHGKPTDTCAIRVLMPHPCSHAPVALLPPHVCHRQGTWQSPEVRTCTITL